jgi:hypothetical protein
MLKILKSDACEKPKTKKCSKALTKYAKKKYSKKEKKEKTTKSETTATTGKGNIQQGTNNKIVTNKFSLPKDSILNSMGGSLSSPSYKYNSNFGTQLGSAYGTGSSWYAPQLNPTPQGGGSRYPTYHSPYGNNNYSVLSEGDKKTLKEYMDMMKEKTKKKTTTETQTDKPPDGYSFSGLGGFKRPSQEINKGATPKYMGMTMVWDKTNPKGNEKRIFDGKELLKGWMPRYEMGEDGQPTGKEFNGDTGKYETRTRDAGSGGGGEGESKGGDDEL